MATTAASLAARARSATAIWLPLVAAAVVAFFGFGVWRVTQRGGSEPGPSGLRSAGQALEVRVEANPDGGFEVTWTAPPTAASYTVEIFEADGTTLWKGDAREPRLRIAAEDLAKARGGSPPMVSIEAFDATQQPVARSAPTALRAPGPEQ